MRTLFLTAVALAVFAATRADAQSPSYSYWGATTQQTVWYAPSTTVYSSPATTWTVTYPSYYYSTPQWSYYSYPAAYESYPTRNVETPYWYTSPYRGGLRRQYERYYDPQIPGGHNH